MAHQGSPHASGNSGRHVTHHTVRAGFGNPDDYSNNTEKSRKLPATSASKSSKPEPPGNGRPNQLSRSRAARDGDNQSTTNARAAVLVLN